MDQSSNANYTNSQIRCYETWIHLSTKLDQRNLVQRQIPPPTAGSDFAIR